MVGHIETGLPHISCIEEAEAVRSLPQVLAPAYINLWPALIMQESHLTSHHTTQHSSPHHQGLVVFFLNNGI